MKVEIGRIYTIEGYNDSLFKAIKDVNDETKIVLQNVSNSRHIIKENDAIVTGEFDCLAG